MGLRCFESRELASGMGEFGPQTQGNHDSEELWPQADPPESSANSQLQVSSLIARDVPALGRRELNFFLDPHAVAELANTT
jgi:hypothetical protein